jgi:hypothetical protein
MKATALALWLALLPAMGLASGGQKPAPEPFYRRYLIPGDPLDDAIVEMEHRVDASPDDPNLRNDFGNLLAARRFPEQAAEQYEKALKLDPKNFISAYNLGLLRETEGKISKAISAYERSISRKPGFPHSHFHLGLLYEHTNRPQDAVIEYAKAMWIDRSMRDPRRNPLVIDSMLIYQASLLNYRRDMAEISMRKEDVYVEPPAFLRAPTDRPLSSQEAGEEESEAPAAPRHVGEPGTAAAGGAAGTAGAAGAESTAPRRGARPAHGETPPPYLGLGPRNPSPPGAPRRHVPSSGPPAREAEPEAEAPPPSPPPVEAAPPEGAPAGEPEAAPEPTPTPGPPAPGEEEPS